MLTVAPVDYRTARYAVEHWHYSARLPVPPLSCFGVWEGDAYRGVVVFGRGASTHLGGQYGFGRFDVVELVRVALRAHDAPVSQLLPLAVSAMRRASPGTRCVLSFADPFYGHRGAIYQAANWLYLGETEPTPMFRSRLTGELLHNRVVSASGYKRQFGVLKMGHRQGDCDRIVVPGKHRYAMPLDRGARRMLTPYVLPHPRGASVEGDTPANRPEGEVRPLGTALA